MMRIVFSTGFIVSLQSSLPPSGSSHRQNAYQRLPWKTAGNVADDETRFLHKFYIIVVRRDAKNPFPSQTVAVSLNPKIPVMRSKRLHVCPFPSYPDNPTWVATCAVFTTPAGSVE